MGGWPAPQALMPGAHIDVALIGLPAWRTSLSPTNAGETPDAVRAVLARYSDALLADRGVREGIRSLAGLTIVDVGDVHEPDGPAGEKRAIEAVAGAAALADIVVAIGGDNSVTVATALGSWGDALPRAGLVTLDAHHDLRDGVNNGAPVRRLIEAGLAGRRVVQIGIADFANSRRYAERALELGITVVHRDELQRRPMADVMEEALEIAGGAGGPVHVDLDLDVCDRSVAPGCPASLPGGISALELRQAARAAGRDRRVRSVDIAEVDAAADSEDGRTVRLAALCVLEVAAGLALRHPHNPHTRPEKEKQP